MRYILVIQAFLVFGFSQAQDFIDQDPFYASEHTPKSPEAASLGQFGRNEVGKYNGKVNIGVPIHTIGWEGLNLPIVLSYDTGGVQVASDASWVGLNWSLSTTYGVSRQIFGLDDFSTELGGLYDNAPLNGYIYNDITVELPEGSGTPRLDLNEILDVHHSLGIESITGNASNALDTQPDVFNIRTLSNSYTFILNKKGASNILTTKIFNNQDAIITYDLATEVFTLIDENGFKYTYGTKDYSTTFYTIQGASSTPSTSYSSCFNDVFLKIDREDTTTITSWLLDAVESPRNRYLNFSYQQGLHFSFPSFTQSGYGRDEWITGNWDTQKTFNTIGLSSGSVSTAVIENNYLTRISGDFGEVLFDLSSREDLATGSTISVLSNGTFNNTFALETANSVIRSCHGQSSCSGSTNLTSYKLSSIRVNSMQNTEVVRADFDYDYFNNNKLSSSDAERYIRLKLDQVSVSGKEYSFDYINPNSLPAKDTNGVDFWGFANGKNSNATKIPKIGRFNTTLIHQSNTILGQTFVTYNGVSRSSNFNYGKNGGLNKITYPTGGYSILEFEANETVLNAPLPFAVTDYMPNPYQSRYRWTNMVDESQYNITYQYLKYSKDSNYNYYTKQMSLDPEDGIVIEQSMYSAFTVDFPSMLDIQGYLKTQSNWSGLEYWGDSARVVLVNTTSGEETVLFTYADAPNEDLNTSAINNVSRVVSLSPGEYRVMGRGIQIPPGADFRDYPPQPAVEYHSTSLNLYTFESMTASQLADFIESFEVGGLRIKTVKNYDDDNSFINGKRFEYNYTGFPASISSSGKLMDDLIFYSKVGGSHSYNPRGYENFYLSDQNQVGGNNSAGGSHIGYSLVREYDLDSFNNTKGYVETKYNNNKNVYYTDSFSLPYSYDTYSSFQDAHIKVFGTRFDWTCAVGVPFGNGCDTPAKSSSSYGYASVKNTVVLGLPLKINFQYSNGNALAERVFDSSGNLVSQTNNTYTSLVGNIPDEHFVNFLSIRMPLTTVVNGKVESSLWNTVEEGPWGSNHHTYFPYRFPVHYGQSVKLSSSETISYFDSDVTVSEQQNYYDLAHHSLIGSETYESTNRVVSTSFYYPYSAEVSSDPHIPDLLSENRFGELIKGKRAIEGQDLMSTSYTYEKSAATSNFTLLQKKTSSKGTSVVSESYFDRYNSYGNPVQVHRADGPSTSYLWGYNGQYPIAKIENATITEIESKIGSVNSIDENDFTAINNLRSQLPNAMVTTYEYDPLVGVTKITDPRGQEITYQYDEFNRLKAALDDDTNLLQEYKYHYKGQN